jgi:glucosamine-phosphate N-acetyltransferase
MSIFLRKLKLSDLNVVLRILKSAFSSYVNTNEVDIIKSIKSENLIPFVVLREEEIIGVATIILYKRLSNGYTAVIEDVAIIDSHQGMGYGKFIIKELIEIARKLDCFKIIAECEKDKIKFYEKCGLHSNGHIVKKLLVT